MTKHFRIVAQRQYRNLLVTALAYLGISARCFCSTVPGDDFNADTAIGASTLQQWYDSTNGLWNSTGWWNAANCVEALENAAFVNNNSQYRNVISNIFAKNLGGNFLDNYYDDDGWWANAWIRAYDETGNSSYLNMAQTIFNAMTNGWDNHCNGGLWWNTSQTNKGSIENCLFMLAAVRLHQRIPSDGTGPMSDFYWATNTWAWFQNSGLINDLNLVNDGLNMTNCENNGDPMWTYEQGLLVGGLTDLYKVTGSSAYLNEAEAFANGIIKWLTDANGVLTEPPPCNPVCGGGDVPQFKGCCIRYIAYLYDETNASAYYSFLYTNAHSVWFRDRNSANQFGFVWDGPLDTTNAARQSSALMAVSGIAEPVTTLLPFAKGSGDPAFNHTTGSAAGNLGWSCSAASAAGLMQSGPYLSSLPAGGHIAHFRMAVNAMSASTSNLVSIAVTQNGATIASENIAWNMFSSANAFQDFPLAFNNTANALLEFRVNWNQSPGAPTLTLSDLTIDGAHNWLAANLAHNIGRLDGLNAWEADPLRDTASGYLITGAGTAELGAGYYNAQFELRVDNFGWTNDAVATLSVADADTGAMVASRTVSRAEFSNTLYRSFNLYFQAVAGAHYNFSVYWNYAPYAPRLTARSVVVAGATGPGFTPIRLTSASYNEDMVVESNAPAIPNGANITASMDNGTVNTGNGWYAQGYDASAPATGLPPPGSIITNEVSSDHVFTLAPSYTANNAAMVDANHNANLVPAVSNSFSALSFLTAAGHGPIMVDYKVQHLDGTVETGIVSSPDWFFNVPFVFYAQGRLDVDSGAFNNVNNNEPRLYAEDIILTNIVSPVTNVGLAWDSGNTTGGHAAFFALSGVTLQPMSLGITSFAGQATLTWPLGLLLDSTNVNGPWTTNFTAVSPYYVAPAGTSRFYRVMVP
ncbi:MAG TPA: glycoside hydrolase family 76 protein [Verrucomicrobiae bacterium]|nr:glycoside hydrolase family 76 protein [Verrucomicrobiae bacterium]